VAVMAGGELRRGRKEIEGLQELEQAGEHELGGTPDEPGDGPPDPVVDGGDGPASPSG
jgi:hypothetical protein